MLMSKRISWGHILPLTASDLTDKVDFQKDVPKTSPKYDMQNFSQKYQRPKT